MGEHSYANGIHVYGWQAELSVTVGKFCSIAEDVVFLAGGEHDYRALSTSPVFDLWSPSGRTNSKGNIRVGNDVWIGHAAIILSGVELADGSVVGAGAVVTKSVPPYAIVAGSPARVIKYRFDDKTIHRLLDSQWWNWDDDMLRKRAHLIRNIDQFLDGVEKPSSSQGVVP
jgi:virginiamycin A acetyltransferase